MMVSVSEGRKEIMTSEADVIGSDIGRDGRASPSVG